MPIVQFPDVNWEIESSRTQRGQQNREERKRLRMEKKRKMGEERNRRAAQAAEGRERCIAFLREMKSKDREYFLTNDADLWNMKALFPEVGPEVVPEDNEEYENYVGRLVEKLSQVGLEDGDGDGHSLTLGQQLNLALWLREHNERVQRLGIDDVRRCNEFLRRLRVAVEDFEHMNFEVDGMSDAEVIRNLCRMLNGDEQGNKNDLKNILLRRPRIQAEAMPQPKFMLFLQVLEALEAKRFHLAIFNNTDGENSDGLTTSGSEDTDSSAENHFKHPSTATQNKTKMDDDEANVRLGQDTQVKHNNHSSESKDSLVDKVIDDVFGRDEEFGRRSSGSAILENAPAQAEGGAGAAQAEGAGEPQAEGGPGEAAVDAQPTREWACADYFDSTMGGRDLRVLFAMALGVEGHELPSHTDPPFSLSKTYHKEIKPDLGTLQQEVVRRYKAYKFMSREPRPKNWRKDKCEKFLKEHPIPSQPPNEIEFLQSELEKWKEIQVMINQSQVAAEDQVIHRTWSTNVPYLRLYHVLVDDELRTAFMRAFAVKSREELDGRNSDMYANADFYFMAAMKFNDDSWVPTSLSLPNLHDDFAESKPLPLNVAAVTPQFVQRKFRDSRYKMVKLIADWEKSGSGRGMATQTEAQVYEFVDGDNRKSFLRERPSHVLYLWHMAYLYEILPTVRQQLPSEASVDGDNAPSLSSSRKRKSSNDDSCAELGSVIRRMTSSIDGLVGVARQSIDTQNMDLLFRRRRELEETIHRLEEEILQYELKALEAQDERRKALYDKAITVKKRELNQKKEEMEAVKKAINDGTNKKQRGSPLFPEFIEVNDDASAHT